MDVEKNDLAENLGKSDLITIANTLLLDSNSIPESGSAAFTDLTAACAKYVEASKSGNGENAAKAIVSLAEMFKNADAETDAEKLKGFAKQVVESL